MAAEPLQSSAVASDARPRRYRGELRRCADESLVWSAALEWSKAVAGNPATVLRQVKAGRGSALAASINGAEVGLLFASLRKPHAYRPRALLVKWLHLPSGGPTGAVLWGLLPVLEKTARVNFCREVVFGADLDAGTLAEALGLVACRAGWCLTLR